MPRTRLPLARPGDAEHVPRATWPAGVPHPPPSCGYFSPRGTLSKPESIFRPLPPAATAAAQTEGPDAGTGEAQRWGTLKGHCGRRRCFPASSRSRQVRLYPPRPGGDPASPHQRCLRSGERGRRGSGRSIRGVRVPFTCPYGKRGGGDALERARTRAASGIRQSGRISSSQGRASESSRCNFPGLLTERSQTAHPSPLIPPTEGTVASFCLKK